MRKKKKNNENKATGKKKETRTEQIWYRVEDSLGQKLLRSQNITLESCLMLTASPIGVKRSLKGTKQAQMSILCISSI